MLGFVYKTQISIHQLSKNTMLVVVVLVILLVIVAVVLLVIPTVLYYIHYRLALLFILMCVNIVYYWCNYAN